MTEREGALKVSPVRRLEPVALAQALALAQGQPAGASTLALPRERESGCCSRALASCAREATKPQSGATATPVGSSGVAGICIKSQSINGMPNTTALRLRLQVRELHASERGGRASRASQPVRSCSSLFLVAVAVAVAAAASRTTTAAATAANARSFGRDKRGAKSFVVPSQPVGRPKRRQESARDAILAVMTLFSLARSLANFRRPARTTI